MILSDTEDEATFRLEVRRWLDTHADLAPQISAQPSPQDVVNWRRWSALLAKSGYAGLTWPAEVGGPARTYAELNIWYEERARAHVPDHFGVIGLDMVGPTIMSWGTQAQKLKFLPPLL